MAADMDDLASALSASFSVSHHEGPTTARHHPAYSSDRSQQYKNKGDRTTEAGQNNRRRRLLDEQKKRREALLEIKRKSKDSDEGVGDEDEEDGADFDKDSANKSHHNQPREMDQYLHQHYHSYPLGEEGEDQMDINDIARKPQRRRPDQIWNTYRDMLMFSEWLVEIPENMETEWLVLPVPMGKRSLVVTSRNQTSSYSKGGMLLNNFDSQLPNGSRRGRSDPQYLLFDSRNAGETMMDCIFSPNFFAYFALDLLMWRDFDVRDCDTEFRMWFLESKLAEITLTRAQKQKNTQTIIRIPCFPCNSEGIRQCFSWQPFPNATVELDGLMFYHKKTAYTVGETPLVGWLKPFMVPEVLGISIPAWIHKPVEYSDFRSHITAFNEMEAQKKAKHMERVEKRKQKQEEHVATELAKTIETKSSRGSKKSSDSQDEIFNQLAKSKSEDKGGWINETLEESLQRTKNKNAEGTAVGGILDELNLDETTSFTNADGKVDLFLMERKMALDAIQDRGLIALNAIQDESQMAMDAAQVEREIEEIKRSEAAASGTGANVPLEKLLTSLGAAGGADRSDEGDRNEADGMDGEEETNDVVETGKVVGFTPAFAPPSN